MVLESILRDNIVNHLTYYGLINSTQSGFMAKRSCATNLLEFVEKITRVFDEGSPLDVVYLDFDKVPHGPLMFVVFINDIDLCSEQLSILAKFADDTKVVNKVSTPEEQEKLQSCLDNLVEWANKWCRKFNTKKCKVLHAGRSNTLHSYTMAGIPLADVEKECDIGVIINNGLKPTSQCVEAERRASEVLMPISKSFLYRDR